MLVLQIITHISWVMLPFTWSTTKITTLLLQWIGLPVYMDNFMVMSARGINMEIIYECTGIYGMIVYVSAVMATRVNVLSRLIGIWVGLPVLWIMNLVRLITIYWITFEHPPLFNFIHTYFWQLFLIIVVILLYYGWYYYVAHQKN